MEERRKEMVSEILSEIGVDACPEEIYSLFLLFVFLKK